jgi:hypothetical protein
VAAAPTEQAPTASKQTIPRRSELARLELDAFPAVPITADARLQPTAKSHAQHALPQSNTSASKKPDPRPKPPVSTSPARGSRSTGSFSPAEDEQIRGLLRRLESQGGSREAALTELSRKLHRSAESVIVRAQQLLAHPLPQQSQCKRSGGATESTHARKKPKPTTHTVPKLPYSDEENEFLLAQLLSALESGITLSKQSDIVVQIATQLGRTPDGIARKLMDLRSKLKPQHTLLSGALVQSTRLSASATTQSAAPAAAHVTHGVKDVHAPPQPGRGQPYTVQEYAVLRDACQRAMAEGVSLYSVAVRLAPRLGRTSGGLEKVLRVIAKQSGFYTSPRARAPSPAAAALVDTQERSPSHASESTATADGRDAQPAAGVVRTPPGGHYAARLHDDDEASFTIATGDGGEDSDDAFTIGSEDISEYSARGEGWR